VSKNGKKHKRKVEQEYRNYTRKVEREIVILQVEYYMVDVYKGWMEVRWSCEQKKGLQKVSGVWDVTKNNTFGFPGRLIEVDSTRSPDGSWHTPRWVFNLTEGELICWGSKFFYFVLEMPFCYPIWNSRDKHEIVVDGQRWNQALPLNDVRPFPTLKIYLKLCRVSYLSHLGPSRGLSGQHHSCSNKIEWAGTTERAQFNRLSPKAIELYIVIRLFREICPV